MSELVMTEDLDIQIVDGDVVFTDTIQPTLYMLIFSKKNKAYAFSSKRNEWIGNKISPQLSELELNTRDVSLIEEQVRASLSNVDAEILVLKTNGKIKIIITIESVIYNLEYEEIL